MNLLHIIVITLVLANYGFSQTIKMSRFYKHKVLNFLSDELFKTDEKVKNITQIGKTDFYNHLFDAYNRKVNELSLVNIGKSRNGTLEVQGANIVLYQYEIQNMYSVNELESVVDFVTQCYQYMKPAHLDIGSGLVSILRAFKTPEINTSLLKATTDKIKAHSFLLGRQFYHFAWEQAGSINLMIGLGYRQLTCGNQEKICDWSEMGLPAEQSKTTCLYRLITDPTITTDK